MIKTWNIDPQPLHYLNCDNKMALPTLKSGLPFTAYWYIAHQVLRIVTNPIVVSLHRFSNVAIGPFWSRYLQARNMAEGRLWRADLCISVWFNRNGRADEEITLKVGCRRHVVVMVHIAKHR